jgi:imidazole glycerol-phosphate synthase subunit HisH
VSGTVIINYGMGNIGSVVNALSALGDPCVVSDGPAALAGADRIVLPGVGAFHAAMDNLRAQGYEDALNEHVVHRRKPFLGICLGMQLVAKDSQELGYSTGLGWIDGHVVKLEPAGGRPVPHVGWNDLEPKRETPLFGALADRPNFFFDHSYHLVCPPELVTATCSYGGDCVAAIQHENILAVQFHPEKSQRNGLRLLRNFLNFAAAL